MSGLFGVQVVVETEHNLASLVVDGEQELILLFAVGEGEDPSGSNIGGVELVDDAHVEPTTSE